MTSADNVKSELHSLLLKDTAVADSSSLDYIRHLASLSLSTILSQPKSLSETSTSLHSSLSDLCAQNYALFIKSHRYSSLLPSSLATITSQLTTLSKSLPPLNDSIANFTAASAPLFQSRKNVESIINNQHYLTDLLEIPQLMDTFVHNGYYEEAIDLSSSVSSLAKSEKYKGNALMQHICQLVLDSQNAMLSELLKSLSGEVKLHVCLRVVGYLKRMNVFKEKELRVVFLSCRDQFLTQLLGSTQNRDSLTLSYLKKYIDTAREHFFDIITYYNSTFPSSISTSTSSYTSSSAPNPTSLLLASYATHFLDILTATLTRYLPHLTTPTSIFSLYNHLMYFGTSLGRLGIDIRSIIGTILLERVETIMT
ncbi:oligomeric Golgi complex subunit 8, partial [Paraphysoderma sedebokerense]